MKLNRKKRYKEGHFLGIGIVIGLPIGIPTSLIIGNIALGPAIGIPIGLLIGSLLEKKLNPNPIELKNEEIKKQKRILWSIAIISIIILILFIELNLNRLT